MIFARFFTVLGSPVVSFFTSNQIRRDALLRVPDLNRSFLPRVGHAEARPSENRIQILHREALNRNNFSEVSKVIRAL